jgi:hypothetical protein
MSTIMSMKKWSMNTAITTMSITSMTTVLKSRRESLTRTATGMRGYCIVTRIIPICIIDITISTLTKNKHSA